MWCWGSNQGITYTGSNGLPVSHTLCYPRFFSFSSIIPPMLCFCCVEMGSYPNNPGWPELTQLSLPSLLDGGGLQSRASIPPFPRIFKSILNHRLLFALAGGCTWLFQNPENWKVRVCYVIEPRIRKGGQSQALIKLKSWFRKKMQEHVINVLNTLCVFCCTHL